MYSEIYRKIAGEITGRIAITENEAKVLGQFIGRVHVETGTLWGGTAIFAALCGAERVYTIDKMEGNFWEIGDTDIGMLKPTPGILLDNIAQFQVAHKIHIFKTHSNPWPIPESIYVDSFFIDGGHDFESCLHDWKIAEYIANQWVIFHDHQYDGVKRVIKQFADKSPEWKFREQKERIIVYER